MRIHHSAILAATLLLAGPPIAGQVEKADVPGIFNYSRIDSSQGFAGTPVAFGGATEPAAMSWLASQGFTTVINLRLSTEPGVDVPGARAAAEAAGLSYVHLPFDSSDPAPDLVDEFLAAVGSAENQPIYLHCGSATRVAALWMIARVLEDGWDFDRARAEAEAIALKPDSAVAFATSYLESRAD